MSNTNISESFIKAAVDETPSMRRPRRQLLVRGGLVVAAGLTALTLTACGGSTSAASTSSNTANAGGSGGQNAPGADSSAQRPGAFGLIAAWSGGVMQVQNSSSQTAVKVTSSTKVTQTLPTTAKAVVVGSCVTVRSAASASGSPASPAASSAPIAAATVSVRPAVNGSCTGGFGNRNGSASPRMRPSGSASGYAGGNFRAFGATGQVASITSSGFVVKESRGGSTSDATVTTSGSTTYTTTASATSAAIKTGECAIAMGTADSTGAVTANSVMLSKPVNGACTSGFGGGFGRNGG